MGGIEVIDGRFASLWARAQDVLGDDARVRFLEIGGSVGAGAADAWSDLDLVVVSEPEHHDDLVASWPEWVSRITPTVFARTPIAPFVINTVTADGLTLDFAIWNGEAPAFPPATTYTVGMLSGQRFDDIGAALDYAVAEQLRGLAGPFVSLVQREEHLKHLTGVPHLLGLLTTVFLAETGAPPPAKQWNATFTEEQRAAVAALPAVGADRERIMSFGLALAELMVTRARPLFDRYELRWPADLATVTAERLRATLDIDAAAWLH